MTIPILDVRQLVHRYGSFQALAGVDLTVHAGEMFGLLGPNGAGKTTFLSIVSGLLTPTGGEILLFGQRFDSRNRDQRRLIGLGTQDLAIYADLTARENLQFFGKLYGLRGATLAKRVDALLDAVTLRDRADDRAGDFSGGMKRRLNLAVAVVHEPKLLFLDEPTTGVDPQSRNAIFEQVQALNRDGLTIVYTSHYMEEVETLCPRIAILDHGTLIACDTLERLLQRLPATIRLRVRPDPTPLLGRLATLQPGVVARMEADRVMVECPSVGPTLVRIIGLLNELGLEPTTIETQEPNLERVFLHLTGHALRDD
ncbi:ABC transporter ATP-binding protein [Tuwongella immobilis]|uniref:ABC transporter domain-containing protein n=1 Tax=Tuwongella immobilis TaxID=692036 RepID=A0A6C2YPI4_9BACT|nr:ABC transporter ATP-binding protein [Tuwongella immobilis]VIP02802.1 antibiotic abc transporter atp-binding protein : Antibiotic ABC transporter ATP-binding protein OS=Paenibacillus sp. FSL H7-0737 GN=H70737_26830 PE=4 SV=1: ABC_tran [Tuwongella immobilis]VTS02494.1 antibiotic abc transporter atp-binding protein : Antibiotic ABC transporter ATP-binding protein OS=Paenibacillus sp. FSL H7-0737 GN=H70737_26830 PE=4 SV=1: ABC_tran [Tuwongella immobilis]